VVAEYAELIEAGVRLPPVDVYYDGTDYWLADGFHRWYAHEKAGREEIECDVHLGDIEHACWHSFAANQTHGLRRTNADKRRAVQAAARHPKAKRWTDRRLAKYLGVSHTLVAKVRHPKPSPRGESGNGCHPGISDAAWVQLSGTRTAENGAELRRLEELEEGTQFRVAKAIADGRAKSVAEAVRLRPTGSASIEISAESVEVKPLPSMCEIQADPERAMFVQFGRRVLEWAGGDPTRLAIARSSLFDLIELVEEAAAA